MTRELNEMLSSLIEGLRPKFGLPRTSSQEKRLEKRLRRQKRVPPGKKMVFGRLVDISGADIKRERKLDALRAKKGMRPKG